MRSRRAQVHLEGSCSKFSEDRAYTGSLVLADGLKQKSSSSWSHSSHFNRRLCVRNAPHHSTFARVSRVPFLLDPLANIGRTILQLDSIRLATHQKLHGISIRQRHIL